jgi:hypothetical protein
VPCTHQTCGNFEPWWTPPKRASTPEALLIHALSNDPGRPRAPRYGAAGSLALAFLIHKPVDPVRDCMHRWRAACARSPPPRTGCLGAARGWRRLSTWRGSSGTHRTCATSWSTFDWGLSSADAAVPAPGVKCVWVVAATSSTCAWAASSVAPRLRAAGVCGGDLGAHTCGLRIDSRITMVSVAPPRASSPSPLCSCSAVCYALSWEGEGAAAVQEWDGRRGFEQGLISWAMSVAPASAR